jgi:glyoxylase-like metal-dependent hydrolase (beta-lactamase superfamily II)
MPNIAEDLAPLLADRPGHLRAVTATHGHPDHIGGAATLAQRHGAEIYLPANTMTYLDGATPRTPSVAKLARTWPLLFGQPFDINAAVGFVRATSSAGFGTSRGMLWHGPHPAGDLRTAHPCPQQPTGPS